MRSHPSKKAEKHRVTKGHMASDKSYGSNGYFLIPSPQKGILKIIASDKLLWDHVSVSLPNRTPSWTEMCYVKDLFWGPDEVVIQYHPAKTDYINNHPYVLHLWRSQYEKIPMPMLKLI